MKDNRWNNALLAAETGLTRESVRLHADGINLMTKKTINSYKSAGVPKSVLTEQFKWMMNR